MLEVRRNDRILCDRYRVIRAPGEGPHSQTLLCEDTQEGRSVVVKELWLDRLDSWKHVELFEREIRVLRLVSHPGVPRVCDSFEHTEDERTSLVLVQELIEGHSLRTRVDQGPLLGENEVVRIAHEVLEILAHVHATFKYDYAVDGVNYRAFIHYPEGMQRYFSPGDAVAVLYDPDEPADSCFVYRPSKPGGRFLARRLPARDA